MSLVQLKRELDELREQVRDMQRLTDSLPTRFALPSGSGGGGDGLGFGLSGFFVCGGVSRGGRVSDVRLRSALVLDVVLNIWRVTIDMPEPIRGNHAVAAIGNEAYACGGNDFDPNGTNDNTYPYVDRFSGATVTWTMMEDMPGGYRPANPAAAGVAGKAHVCGGSYRNVPAIFFDAHVSLDPATEAWSGKAPLMNPERAKHAATAVDATMHVVGGQGLSVGRLVNHDLYDQTANSWTVGLANLKSPQRQDLGAATVDGKVYAVGGGTSGGSFLIDSNLEFSPGASSWVTKQAVPRGRWLHATGSVGSDVLITGGQSAGDRYIADSNKFNPATDSWVDMAPLSMGPRIQFAGAGI